MSKFKTELSYLIDAQLELLLGAIMRSGPVVLDGDILPEQSVLWDQLVGYMSQLFVDIIQQNSRH
ncbi:MAG: hypothetical protein WC307_06000 [Candidatus Nanoarchaeia archaeon]|jgi:hypothetical protein